MFNLLEIKLTNEIRIRELTAEATADRPSQFHSSHVDSRDEGRFNFDRELIHLKDEDELVQRVVAAFPYSPLSTTGNPPRPVFDLGDGYHDVVTRIRVLAASQSAIAYERRVWEIKDGFVVAEQTHPLKAVSCFDDLSEHPEKVQQVAAIVFTDDVKAKERARQKAR